VGIFRILAQGTPVYDFLLMQKNRRSPYPSHVPTGRLISRALKVHLDQARDTLSIEEKIMHATRSNSLRSFCIRPKQIYVRID
jgi:hypothetical protein